MIDQSALETLFLNARTYRGPNAWLPRAIDDALLQRVWELAALPPTSANCSPARIVFVRSPVAKAKLKETLIPSNVEQTMAAPVTAIVAMDLTFYEHLEFLYPGGGARAWFEGNAPLIEATAFRNSSLQGAYLIMAARALGLDCGPMSGFDNAKLDTLFFAGSSYRSNFLVNLGYGTLGNPRQRNPRFSFERACRIE